MNNSRKLSPALHLAARFRWRTRARSFFGLSSLLLAAVVGAWFALHPKHPTLLSAPEQRDLVGSGTCVIDSRTGALLGRLIDEFTPSEFNPKTQYLVADTRLRSTRAIDINGTRLVACATTSPP
jgi:hypothetical protein